jgi:hypothetical protein
MMMVLICSVTHEHVVKCLRELTEYNGALHKDSIGAGIYIIFVDELFKLLMEKLKLDENLMLRVKGCGLNPALFAVNEYFGHEVHTIEKLIHYPQLFSVPDLFTSMVRTIFSLRKQLKLKQAPQDPHEVILGDGYWDHLMNRDRNMTIDEEISLYKYGNYHQLYLQHAFGQMIKAFNRGPYPHGGVSLFTVIC